MTHVHQCTDEHQCSPSSSALRSLQAPCLVVYIEPFSSHPPADGVKLTDEQAMASAGLDVVDFVDIGVECTLRQLLEHGFFHADPHPGNLLATKDGDECYLTYLDFGMCVWCKMCRDMCV